MYDKNNVADCITLFAIYMLIIRKKMQAFVRFWNIYFIRKQFNRFNVVVEKSFKNYFCFDDEMQNFQMISFSNLLVIMKVDVTNYNKNKEFIIIVRRLLTKHKYRRIFFSSTKEWCDAKFQKLSYDANIITVDMTFFNEENQHCTIYVDLRRAIHEYIVNENTS